MINQEMASIIQFTLDKTGQPAPYYSEVPEGVRLPAVYFPPPEVASRGDTLSSYALGYTWKIRFFHKDTPSAYQLARLALEAMQAARMRIPLIGEAGAAAGRCFRVKNAALGETGGQIGTVTLELSWDSLRPYDERDYQAIARVNVTRQIITNR